MHSFEITSSQINPTLGVKVLTKRSWSWLDSEHSTRLSPGLLWSEQHLLVLRLIPAIELVEIHCFPQWPPSAHIWWVCMSEKVEYNQEVVNTAPKYKNFVPLCPIILCTFQPPQCSTVAFCMFLWFCPFVLSSALFSLVYLLRWSVSPDCNYKRQRLNLAGLILEVLVD